MPTPHAQPIPLSLRQKALLEQIARQTTKPYRLVRRVQALGRCRGGEQQRLGEATAPESEPGASMAWSVASRERVIARSRV
nr:hypothetical protein [Stenomitos frigidus]